MRKKVFNLIVIIVFCVTLVLMLSKESTTSNNNSTTFKKDVVVNEFEVSENPIFNVSDNKYIFYTTNYQTSLLQKDGTQKWQTIYGFENASYKYKDGILGVFEKNGNKVYVFNKDGVMYNIQVNGKVMQIDVNKEGYLSLISNNGEHYNILVYNEKGQKIISQQHHKEISNEVYPLNTALSEDSSIYSLSSIDTSYFRVRSSISLNTIKKEHGMFAGIQFLDEVVGNIEFYKNYIIAYTDKGLVINELNGNSIVEKSKIVFNSYIEYVEVLEDVVAIGFGSEKSSISNIKQGDIHIYDFDGNLKGSFHNNEKITFMTKDKNKIIVNYNNKCYVINDKGKQLLFYTHSKDLKSSFLLDNKTFLLIEKNRSIVVTKE